MLEKDQPPPLDYRNAGKGKAGSKIHHRDTEGTERRQESSFQTLYALCRLRVFVVNCYFSGE